MIRSSFTSCKTRQSQSLQKRTCVSVINKPATVLAAVRLRGTKGWDGKAIIATGVRLLYGQHFLDLEQNVLDAVAVGKCHLDSLAEKVLGRNALTSLT